MDKMTHEIRAASWRSVISQCQARLAEQTRKQWLVQNGISEKSYYYWQRKLRREAYELLPPAQEESTSPYVEPGEPLLVRRSGGDILFPLDFISFPLQPGKQIFQARGHGDQSVTTM